jgi:hypothetical protein
MSAYVALSKSLKKWANPNPTAEPIYSSESKNVFLQLQRQTELNQTFDSDEEFVLLKPLPPPADMGVQMVDSNYISYFLNEVPRVLGCTCCTPQIVDIFMQSINQPILRHSILALSSALCIGSRSSSVYTRNKIQRIIPQIKEAITSVTIGSSHIVAVTFLAWLALAKGDLHAAHRHVGGLFSMLQTTHHLSSTADPLRPEPNPLVMFLFRLAVKADNTLGSRNQPYVFPVLRDHETYHRRWLTVATSSEVHLQYCLATIKLDDLANHIGHIHMGVDKLKMSGVHSEERTIVQTERIRIEHKTWLYRAYIHRHIGGNDPVTWKEWTEEQPMPINTFLEHRPYSIFDPLVAHMHLLHASLGIHLSIVKSERFQEYDDECFDAAILIARIYTALNNARVSGNGGNDVLIALWLAGLVFADKARPSQAGTSTVFI